jgi:hypothetical protein
MSITKFSFEDGIRGWKLNEVAFDDFNLLVGASGVGKTQILRAVRKVINAGTIGTDGLVECNWMIEIKGEDRSYRWIAETEGYPGDEDSIDRFIFLKSHWLHLERLSSLMSLRTAWESIAFLR